MKTIFKVGIFAIAFAFVEGAVVVYLRHLLGSSYPLVARDEILFLVPGVAFLEPETALKIIQNSQLLLVEQVREAATLVMLASVTAIAGKTFRERLAYFFFIFGIWDIFYYVFLKLTIGWPKSFGDIDVFFLLPTPWVGPVIAPIAVSIISTTLGLAYLKKHKQ